MKKIVTILIALLLVVGMPSMAFATEPETTTTEPAVEPATPTTETAVTTPTAEPTVAEPTVMTPTAEPTVAEPTVTTPTAEPVAEPTPTTEPTTTKMVTPVAVDDEFASTERGIVTGNALANDSWDPTADPAELVSATLIYTWDERDDSEPPVTFTYDPAGDVSADFGPYDGTDTGLVRVAWVDYELRDSAGQTANASITFVETAPTSDPDPDPDPPVFDAPVANGDLFGDPANHTVSGDVILNDTFDHALTVSVASASIVSSFINGVESTDFPTAWSLTFDPEGTVSVYFGQELPGSDVPAAQVRYRLEDSEGNWSEAIAWFNYGVQSILNGCTATTDISWGAVLEQIDPGNATSWTGDEVTSESLTFELLANGSLRITEVMDADRCANTVAIFTGTIFLSNLIASMPPVVEEPAPPVVTPPVVEEPAPPVVTPPVVDVPAPPEVTPPVVDVPAPPKVVNDPPAVIPNAGASADAGSPSSALLAIMALILLTSGALVMATPGKKK